MKFCLFFLSICTTGFAALPPMAQSAREMQAVLADPKLQEYLGSAEPIQEIKRTEEGYLVLTEHFVMKVDVVYSQAKRPGPVPFELEFQRPVDLRSGEKK